MMIRLYPDKDATGFRVGTYYLLSGDEPYLSFRTPGLIREINPDGRRFAGASLIEPDGRAAPYGGEASEGTEIVGGSRVSAICDTLDEVNGLIEGDRKARADFDRAVAQITARQMLLGTAPPKIVRPVEGSVTQTQIFCLFDGTPRVFLGRYVMKKYGMTPDEYRSYCGLPHDYPMIAQTYLALRFARGEKPRLRLVENTDDESPDDGKGP
jgi:predicted transcriptional regulator